MSRKEGSLWMLWFKLQCYLYQFYIKVAENITHSTPEEAMARALYFDSGIVAEEMLKNVDPKAYESIVTMHESDGE